MVFNLLITLLFWITVLIGLYISVFWMVMFFESRFKDASSNRKPKRFPVVSILVPSYNAGSTIVQCLQAVANLKYPKNKLEVIIIDDGSTDSTFSQASKFIKQHSYMRILQQSNQGKATALNNALATTSGEFFACIDADSFIEPDTLHKMMCMFEERGKDLVIVTPAMKVYKPTTILERLQNFEYLIAMLINRINTGLESIYVAPGPFSVYRTNIVKKHGGFDVHNLTEDMEIAYRMQKHRYKIAQCYDGYVYTQAPTTLKQLYKQRKRWYKGGFLNLLKYRSMLFNPSYGHFGMYQIPLTLVSFFMAFLVLFFFSYFVIYPLANTIYNLYLVNFDLLPYLASLSFKFDLLSLNMSMLSVLFASFLVGVFLLVASHTNAREKIRLVTVSYLVPYFLFYYLVIGFFCVSAVFDAFFGDKQKW